MDRRKFFRRAAGVGAAAAMVGTAAAGTLPATEPDDSMRCSRCRIVRRSKDGTGFMAISFAAYVDSDRHFREAYPELKPPGPRINICYACLQELFESYAHR